MTYLKQEKGQTFKIHLRKIEGRFPYFQIDKIASETTPLGTINYSYDALGRRTKMQVAGQEPVMYQYDSNSRLTNILTSVIAVSQSPEQIEGVAWQSNSFDFTYDSLGRRTSLTLPNGITTNYNYDNASRLLEMKHLNSLNLELEVLNYLYDANGNRTSMNRPSVTQPLRDAVTSATYDSANEMLSFTPATSSTKNITYDNNGNMTSVTNSCGTTTYTWDARNRLSAINGFKADCSSLTASFKYDALGRRIEKTINGVTTQYLYDGLDVIQEMQNNTVTANYIRTLNIDEPLARVKADGTIRYYQTDALGSVIALTDDTGAVKTRYSYDPFGAVTISGESSDNPFQYTGRENDNTGLYYYRARYYSPELQRFISEDPIGLGGGINPYIYVGNNSIRFSDPYGLQPPYVSDPVTTRPFYGGGEAHALLGGGIETLLCCNGNRLILRVYAKVCLGSALGGSVSIGRVFNVRPKTCPDFGGPSMEGGGGPVEAGTSINPELPVTVGVGYGTGFKFTPCWYFLIKEKDLGCCEKK